MRTAHRWLLVLPAALSAYAYVQVLACLTGYLLDDRVCCALLASIFSAFVMVWTGARTAPRFQAGVAAALVLSHWILLNLAGSDAVFEMLYAPKLLSLTRFCGIAATLAATFAVYIASRQRGEPELLTRSDRVLLPILEPIETIPVATKGVDSQFWRATTVTLQRETISS